MTEKLLPCPFCGSGRTNTYKGHKGTQAQCLDCGASGIKVSVWNTRASGWQPIEKAPKDGGEFVKLLLGESVPDVPFVQVGQYCNSDDCAELGYGEHKDGGWLIYSLNAEDFYVVDIDEPLAWSPVLSLPPAPQGEG